MISLKLIAALLVLLAGVCGGIFATRLSKGRESLTSLANTFAGGIFLGATFLHMLPDAIEKFNTFVPDMEYPLFALVAAAGFLLVLMLDKVIVSPEKGLSDEGAIYPYILMGTLSIHSVITGVALGLEDHVVSAVAIMLAVLAHKSTAAMALAVSFGR
jgi:zinc transporter 1/2/3